MPCLLPCNPWNRCMLQTAQSQLLPTLLQKRATFAPFVLPDLQGSPGGHFKHFPHSILCLGGAFKVAKSIDSVRCVSAIFRLHRLLRKNDDKQFDYYLALPDITIEKSKVTPVLTSS
uniref:Uncharacterized protein n=1 Tax=Micrurus spixii TaxID=129469 RepID=A0A2D4MVS1_9SAUR